MGNLKRFLLKFSAAYRPEGKPIIQRPKNDTYELTAAKCKASLVAIHYHATKLYNMLEDELPSGPRFFSTWFPRNPEQSIAYKCIIHSIIKECEDRIPELRKGFADEVAGPKNRTP
jgi:hypothetical protein